VMTKLGRPGFVWVGIKPWRMLAVRVIHLGYQRGGSGLGWVIPAARAARGGEHAGVRAFWAQLRPKRYGLWCITTREGKGSSPRARGGRSCSGGRKPTTTGGGNGAALVDRRQQGGSGSLGCTGWSRKHLRRSPGGQSSPRSAGTEGIGVAARLTGDGFFVKLR
jgi:hypothetical protein